MSDDGQQFSIANQKAAIEEYAKQHNFVVVRTYEDAGKSGLALKRRKGLCDLIEDVVSGKPEYKAILVYDVSRWGRFQNNDEAAHYEFMCTSASIPLHYCAEQFANDDTPASAILKALKRSMAAEFSRELAEKVFRGKTRLVQLGFWVGGMAGYGLSRMMISAAGKPKQKMKFGEHKSLTTDRVILIPGPRWEVETVRKMFRMALDGLGCTAIARELSRQGLKCYGKPWAHRQVMLMLTNPKYAGCNVWNRTSQRLGSKVRRTQQKDWIMKPDVFTPIVDHETFDSVQVLLQRKAIAPFWSDEEIVKCLRRLLLKKGKLSERLISETRGMPAIGTIHRHLGSYEQIYKRVGFEYRQLDIFRGQQQERSMQLRRAIVKQLTEMFPESVTVQVGGGGRSILRIDDRFLVSLLLCRTKRRKKQKPHWVVEPNAAEREYVTDLIPSFRTKLSMISVLSDSAIHLRSVCRSSDYFHVLRCHPWPCMLLNLRFQADSNPSLSARNSSTCGSTNHFANQLGPCQRQANNFLVCLSHLRRCCGTVHIHRGSDVSVPHEPLLDTHRCANCVQPRPVRMTEGMRTDVTDARVFRCLA
ncbi:MAG: recombinase family protein [Acidobacteriia bacterium]|nr:recombinase family protein [Terriglobia bacterium]